MGWEPSHNVVTKCTSISSQSPGIGTIIMLHLYCYMTITFSILNKNASSDRIILCFAENSTGPGTLMNSIISYTCAHRESVGLDVMLYMQFYTLMMRFRNHSMWFSGGESTHQPLKEILTTVTEDVPNTVEKDHKCCTSSNHPLRLMVGSYI